MRDHTAGHQFLCERDHAARTKKSNTSAPAMIRKWPRSSPNRPGAANPMSPNSTTTTPSIWIKSRVFGKALISTSALTRATPLRSDMETEHGRGVECSAIVRYPILHIISTIPTAIPNWARRKSFDHRDARKSWRARAKSRHCCQSAHPPTKNVAPVATVPPCRCRYGRIPSIHTPSAAQSETANTRAPINVTAPLIANHRLTCHFALITVQWVAFRADLR
jgi:hypothetical protein